MSHETTFHLVIISGVSGAGKSLALNALEDCGYFCIDNLPAPLFSQFTDFLRRVVQEGTQVVNNHYRRVALLVDCREKNFFAPIQQAIKELESIAVKVSLIYLDCDDEIILRRFKTTRRPHPLLMGEKNNRTILEALIEERKLLAQFRAASEQVIDTTSYSPHHLRGVIENYIFTDKEQAPKLDINLVSFGYKYGLPTEADLVIDIRFLPNPNFVAELNPLTGRDKAVQEFIFNNPQTDIFLSKLHTFLKFLLPCYQAEGKRYLTLAIGCTGGKHRSVAIVEHLSTRLKALDLACTNYHRDIERGV